MPFPENLIAALVVLNPTWFILALIAIFLDLVTGFVIKGLIPHNVSSSIMREGLAHKAWEVAIILCAALIDVAISVGLGIGLQPMSAITCAFIFIMELASVCENALEGNAELRNAPIVKYVLQYVAETSVEVEPNNPIDPDATVELGKHIQRYGDD